MTNAKPVGTIQVDVDDLWVYYHSIGLPAPENCPAPAYEEGLPRLLDLFDHFDVRATFFVCGSDLFDREALLAEMIQRGHEIANHSTWHDTGFAWLTTGEKRADIATTGELIRAATGASPRGFKSPGFSFATDQLAVLRSLGYRYDSSLLPTPYAPLMRQAQRFLSGQAVDPSHYGRASYGSAPLRPYAPRPDSPQRPLKNGHGRGPDALLEAPVTTMPVTRLPMHSTFVLAAGQRLFDTGLALAKARRTPVNYLFHAADAFDPVADPALRSYRFLQQSWPDKRALLEHMLAALSSVYHLVPTLEYVNALAK